ncbi:MAG: nucleotide exchange factor GrpE [Gloeomargarita sp. SKYBB_i_bin120]|nr:nucleotide exchange factor GrpE [Gloeomargarita sp. SKYG98]MCS7291518.1 nucleotide exchange factor GrpE [Gloeomargarita sp. SKYB120]MDW8177078.1 nucleotide exchange factor GrpE [Gloeomargarita sp. SKYBB_i_bin120]
MVSTPSHPENDHPEQVPAEAVGTTESEKPPAVETVETETPEPPMTFGDLQLAEEATPEAMVALREELLQERERYATLKQAHQELEQQLQTLQQQLEEKHNQMLRLAADFDNYRRRMQREMEEAAFRAKAKVLMELLAVVDNFERARAHLQPETEEGMTIHKSYQGVYKQMVEELKKMGVAPIPSKGQPFDPTRHEAILQEASDEYPEGTVIEELRRGYFLKVGDQERVLRHALVKVSTGSQNPPSESPPAENS